MPKIRFHSLENMEIEVAVKLINLLNNNHIVVTVENGKIYCEK